MRTKLMLAAVAAGVCGAIAAPAGLASAEESPQELISRLQSEGYTVNIDRVGTAPLNQCVVTNVRNPQQVHAVGAVHRPRQGRRPRARAGGHQPVDFGDPELLRLSRSESPIRW